MKLSVSIEVDSDGKIISPPRVECDGRGVSLGTLAGAITECVKALIGMAFHVARDSDDLAFALTLLSTLFGVDPDRMRGGGRMIRESEREN